ncbi:MAG: Crp/Fnr family transcriptional regulator [Burkholderiales bacterium]
MEISKIHTLLANVPLFSALQPADIARITLGSRAQKAARGNFLFHSGDLPSGFYVIVYGLVKLIFTSSQGMEKVMQLMGPGESFGEAVMFLDKPYLVSSQALADSLLVHIGKEVLLDEIERNPGFARKMLAGLSMRLHTLVRDVEAYSLRSSAQRVIGYLLQNDREPAADGDSLRFNFPASKHVIASRLNITPETLSRVLHDLSASGLIRVEGKKVAVLDIESLRSYS